MKLKNKRNNQASKFDKAALAKSAKIYFDAGKSDLKPQLTVNWMHS